MAANMHSAARGRNNKLHTATRASAEGGPDAYVSVHERLYTGRNSLGILANISANVLYSNKVYKRCYNADTCAPVEQTLDSVVQFFFWLFLCLMQHRCLFQVPETILSPLLH